jgi:hypothetical protein
MSDLTEYTIEIYKLDKRCKEGRRLVAVQDFAPSTRAYIECVAEQKTKLGFVVDIFETFITRKNMMTGIEFEERYDTPYFCSPSSETYWSM